MSVAVIGDYMKSAPYTIGENISLEKAQQLFREHKIRHLPVLYGGQIRGILSERDLNLTILSSDEGKDTMVSDLMTETPYSVKEDTPLLKVVSDMAEQKIGSALVTDDAGSLVGIFTAVDALGVLAKQLSDID